MAVLAVLVVPVVLQLLEQLVSAAPAALVVPVESAVQA
jgi:hypothetical protein